MQRTKHIHQLHSLPDGGPPAWPHSMLQQYTDQVLKLHSTVPDDRLTLRQKLISLRTSMMDTSWGVVTIMAPSTLEAFRNCAIEMCSSDVLQQGGQLAAGWCR